MDSDLTPRQKAEGVMAQWRSGVYVGEPGLVDAITTAIQRQSNEDLARHRAKRADLEADLAERDAEIARLNKTWDNAVDYGARLRTALRETREALRRHDKWQNDQTLEVIQGVTLAEAYGESELCEITLAVLARYAALAGEEVDRG